MAAQTTTGLRAVLSVAKVYELWSSAVGGQRGRTSLVAEYVRPGVGERVLDLGCGPAELLPYLDGVEYVGIDISEPYIQRARERFGTRGRFEVGDATSFGNELGQFDIVLAFGVLHHLDDDHVTHLFHAAREALAPGGRVVTVDPTFVERQHRAARVVIARDRGMHVRSPAEYEALARTSLGDVQVGVRHDLLRIPYSHCVLVCRAQERAGAVA